MVLLKADAEPEPAVARLATIIIQGLAPDLPDDSTFLYGTTAGAPAK